ncbi:MAG: ribosome biogenesis GTPase Der [Deltaproteobacteria bacterium]|nr:MAG: ribosome biogenesis GTPase Der [Deltaproteobacteria bacterium]
MNPIVAIVGRPNVGKSTLFNRLTRRRDAIVDDMPGVTRDRHYGDATWNGQTFTLVDTGGILADDEDGFAGQIQTQVEEAIEDADVIILLLDGKTGVSPFDMELARMLRVIKKPVFAAINKIDSPEQESRLSDFYSLGLDDLYPVSAEHRYGVSDFLDALTAGFESRKTDAESDSPDETIRLAVIGRPNVGKSSLVNRILGEERVVVSQVPGTTRDAIDTPFQFNEQKYLIIDTAGIRRKGKVHQRLEKFSIIKALRSLDRCHLALVVIDADEGITDQDISIAGYAHERGCGCIFLLNKWDLVKKDTYTADQYIENLRSAAKFLNFAPAITISAKTGLRIRKIFTLINKVYDQYAVRIDTGPLNRIFERAVTRNEPSLHRGRRIKFFYATQISTRPPTFLAFVNYPNAVHFSYRRYLMNQIRSETGLTHTPIRLYFRKRGDRRKSSK